MALVKMIPISNSLETYNDRDVVTKFQIAVTSSDGDSDIITIPNQVLSVSFTFDVTTGEGSGTVYVTSASREDIISGAAKWEPFTSSPSTVDQFDETENGVTAIKCNRATGSVKLTVTSGNIHNM